MVISLILIGVGLIVLEIVIIPGTTIVGIIGICLAIAGVFLSFRLFDSATGWAVLGATAVVSGGMFYWSFRSKAWSRFSLKDTIDSKVNEGIFLDLEIGLEGVAISALRPMGKAEVKGKVYEARTLGDFVPTGTKIRIVKILMNQILVEPIN